MLTSTILQVISEPGVDAALDAEWEGKVVFVEGVEAMAEQLRLYRCVPLLSWDDACMCGGIPGEQRPCRTLAIVAQ